MRAAATLTLIALLLAACGSDRTAVDATVDANVDGAGTSAPARDRAPDEPATDGTSAGTPGTGVARAPVAPNAPVRRLAAGWNDAGFDLMRTLPLDENLVFSPAGIGHALTMVAPAADAMTRAEIDEAFGLPARAHEAWNAIDQQLAASNDEQVTVRVADRIWPRVDVEPAQEWVDLLAAYHGVDVMPLDFQGDAAGSRRTINDWVSAATEDLIPELLPEGFISDRTVLVLTDAIYFDARWETPFGKYGPVEGVFTTLDGQSRDVSFLKEIELFDRHGRGDGFDAAEIPYAGDYSMLVLVPDDGTFEGFRQRLDQDLLDEVDATLTDGQYGLLLPKWEDSETIDLMEWLGEIGAAPGRYPTIGGELGAAVHGADIAVDENGTVAAAATALGFEVSGSAEPEFTLEADRPFVYLIRHRSSGLVLFAGTVVDPT